MLLRDGRGEQVGAPKEIYGEPVSAYAAGFMGYRNMLELDVAKAGGDHATVANGGLRLRGLDRRTGDSRRAVVAIRLEDFTVGGSGNAIRVRVEVVEYRGRSRPSRRLRPPSDGCRSSPARLVPSDEITLGVVSDQTARNARRAARCARSHTVAQM